MEKVPSLVTLDWIIIGLFFLSTLIIGLYFSKRAKSSLSDYFVAGRKMTWWIAGTSIVATTFGADTPLVLAGWARTSGIEKNWFWWGSLMGVMLCTFFFARLWKRAHLLTDVEFNELRYSGKPAAGLRIFIASYRSIIQNTLVMGFVTLGMAKIMEVTLDIPTIVFIKGQIFPVFVPKGVELSSVIDMVSIAHWPVIGSAIIPAKATGIIGCLLVAAFYSAVSGLWGVMATDFFQFGFAMIGTFIFMIIIFVISDGPKQLISKAYDSVKEGLVVNGAPFHRGDMDDEIRGIFAKNNSEEYALNPVGKMDLLVDKGIFLKDENNKYHLNFTGMTEKEVSQALENIPNKDEILNLWKKHYTISLAKFSDSLTVKKLLASGILSKDSEDMDYYRIKRILLNEEELTTLLDSNGIENKSEVMAAWHDDEVVSAPKIISFLPPFDLKGGGLMALWSIIVFIGLQWWSGGEGGGYMAQRIFSCKNEKHSMLAVLWFALAHFALRPWPWIIVGIASLFLIPDITVYGKNFDEEYAYVVMLMLYMPVGLKGLMVASLMAAYMSTISTHVNFGASYIINDLYKRFIVKKKSENHYVRVSQVTSIILAILAGLYAFFSESIATSWFIIMEVVSGAGLVILLRWYWWRISAWSELAAMSASLLMYALLNWTHFFQSIFGFAGLPEYWLDEYAVRFSLNLVISTIIWVTVTFLTPPEKEEHLIRFFKRVGPGGWWEPISKLAGNVSALKTGKIEWVCWFFGSTGLIAIIACFGKACFGLYFQSFLFAVYSIIAIFYLFKYIKKMDWAVIESSE